jgi:hypothetical protein
VVRAPALLSATGAAPRRHARPALLGGLIAALALWDAYADRLPSLSDRWDVALVAGLLFPATFLISWLLLPLADRGGLFLAALAVGAVAAVCDLAGLDGIFNVAKVVAFTLFGFWFVQMLESLVWVVLVAAAIPWVDVASVYRGPTKVVVEEQPGLFERIAVAFAVPGENDAARLGPPDVIFFALFLAAASRFGLRVGATWIGMTAALSATLVATYAFDLRGLPALPALSVGFLLPNADLVWRSLTTKGRGERRAPS